MSAKPQPGGSGYLKRKEGKQISACCQAYSIADAERCLSRGHGHPHRHCKRGSMCRLAALLHLACFWGTGALQCKLGFQPLAPTRLQLGHPVLWPHCLLTGWLYPMQSPSGGSLPATTLPGRAALRKPGLVFSVAVVQSPADVRLTPQSWGEISGLRLNNQAHG